MKGKKHQSFTEGEFVAADESWPMPKLHDMVYASGRFRQKAKKRRRGRVDQNRPQTLRGHRH